MKIHQIAISHQNKLKVQSHLIVQQDDSLNQDTTQTLFP